MIDSMIIELDIRSDYLNHQSIESIYFGGGTPSVIESQYIKRLIAKIKSTYNVLTNAEITMEFNPDDLSDKKIYELKKLGVNRLSIGIQSFNDKDLIFMNRSHNSKEAISAVNIAKENGINNITVDLIYGLPNQTNKMWEENLNILFDLDINHFSAYALTVEPKTQLHHLIKKNKIEPLKDTVIEEQFRILQNKSEEMGYMQYEISNFCREEMLSQHNSSYWKNKWYLGIGPSAHSYNGISRQWNIASNSKYIDNIKDKEKVFEIEILSQEQMYNEYMLTSLRTSWGISIDYLSKNFNININKYFKNSCQKWIENKKIILDNNSYRLTKEGMLFADAISSDLFMI
jgi:oxygen-independent coproporphyrinogen-3 oxidase|tara:strand:+ start:535 stop:1569 length:1035 start_codon:yes stop_codon:yes gene_type:complete